MRLHGGLWGVGGGTSVRVLAADRPPPYRDAMGGREQGGSQRLDGRCRLVDKEDAFFAATPPLEALRLLLSHVATGRKGKVRGRKVMILDAEKPHLHAFAEREVYVELPPRAAASWGLRSARP